MTTSIPDPLTEHRERIIPYRMKALNIANLALAFKNSWAEPRPMEIYFDGRLQIEGQSTGFTNPAIEAGILHCRALLEFMGLELPRGSLNRLTQRSRKREDDVGIEDFGLKLVTVDQATSKFKGGRDEAEAALAMVIASANKYLAHNTTMLPDNPEQARLLEIATRVTPWLVICYFYTRLGLPAPEYVIASRKRDEEVER